MSKMGSHDSFGHLKHQLWPKEGPRVKLTIWPPTTKSRKLTWLPCMHVACNIPLESSRRRLQLCFILHLNENFMTSILGVPRQNAIWMWASWRGTKYTIRGKVVASPKSRPWWVLWVWICRWLVLAPKVLELCTNHLVFGFV
jgi:hypothetical protein